MDLEHKTMRPPSSADLEHKTTRPHRLIPKLWPLKLQGGEGSEPGAEEVEAHMILMEGIAGNLIYFILTIQFSFLFNIF